MSTPVKTLLTLLLAGAATAVPGHADPVVFKQPYSVGQYNSWESYTSPSGDGGQTYEDFTLGAATAITTVAWHGDYVDTGNPERNPEAPNTREFEFSFWSDNQGQPGVLLSKQSVPLTSVSPTSLGTIGLGLGQGTYQVPFFAYSATLPSPFTAGGGQKYWLSIRSLSTSAQPTWSWYSGSGGNGVTVQDFNGTRQNRELDRSLELQGVPATVTTPALVVTTTNKTAHAGDGTPAEVTLTLSQAPAAKVVVKYTLSGSAVNGQDYVLLKGKAKFKPGQATTTVMVQPQGDLGGAAKKGVKISFQVGNGYTLGSQTSAKLKIVNP